MFISWSELTVQATGMLGISGKKFSKKRDWLVEVKLFDSARFVQLSFDKPSLPSANIFFNAMLGYP
jgi:hypothetical protein